MNAKKEHLWAEKYRPKTVDDITGNKSKAKEVLTWVEDWINGKQDKKALLLYGPPGTGKTATVHAVARQLSIDLLEVNASDKRNAESIRNIVGAASLQASLFSSKIRIILIDEVDGISGTEDRGGINELLKILKSTINPIIMTANDPWSPSLRPVRDLCLMVQYRRVTPASIISILKQVCSSEGIEYEETALKKIAEASGGDIRSAINDLQFFAEGVKHIRERDIIFSGSRDRTIQVFEALKQLFEAKEVNSAKASYDTVDMDYDMFFKWVVENAFLHAKTAEELKNVYDYLSKADIILSKIVRTNNWGILKYFILLMTAGVALSVTDKYGYKKYQFPSWINRLSASKKERELATNICLKVKSKCHISIKKAHSTFLPILKVIFQNNPVEAAKLATYFGFEEEEINWLSGENAKKIIKAISGKSA